MEKVDNFNPSSFGSSDNDIFGLPFTIETAKTVVIPVPWDVTVSYSDGTSNAPDAIYEASMQVDLFDPFLKDAWKLGIAMDKVNKNLKAKNKKLREVSKKYIDFLINGGDVEKNSKMKKDLALVNSECKKMNEFVKERANYFFKKNKTVCVLGGEHSVPLGLIEACTEKFGDIGVLHIDAHADLREAYEGFEFSHASIMFNVLKNKKVKKLVQVGIRDFCEDEVDLIKNSKKRVETYFDRDLKHRSYKGESWQKTAKEIISKLPKKIYVSFDIDGLDSKYCPNTGTPVPGGLEYEQAMYLFEELALSGREIVAFDLNEVGPSKNKKDEWDANVGARVLYRLINITQKSKMVRG